MASTSARNAELLQTLSSTDEAAASVQHQHELISELEASLKECKGKIRHLTFVREQEQKDHEGMKGSFFRKRLSNKEKFNAKAEKEEREYFEALRAETLAKQEQDELVRAIDDANRVLKEELEPAMTRHAEAQKALDQLYESLFDGPTPSFPEEDELEKKSSAALVSFTQKREAFLAEDQARKCLAQAWACMNRAIDSASSAHTASTIDVFGGGMMSDMMERDSLSQAQAAVHQVQMFVVQAMKASRDVVPPPEMRVAHGHVMSDMVFDNIFTDMAMHQRIEQTQMELRMGERHVDIEFKKSQTRVKSLQEDLKVLEGELTKARKDLQDCRARTFETVLQGGQLPSYHH